MIRIEVNNEGAYKKTAVLRRVPAAFFRNADDWAGATILYIKQSYQGGRVFKRPPKELDSRLKKVVVRSGPKDAQILIGTGRYIGMDEVRYARIQEEGGWVVAKKRSLTIPMPGIKNPASSYRPNSFIINGKGADSGLIVQKMPGRKGTLRVLFVLRRSVKLPARYWFSRPIAERMPKLDKMMSDVGVWATASMMAYRAEEAKK